jgi:hypothetical protein
MHRVTISLFDLDDFGWRFHTQSCDMVALLMPLYLRKTSICASSLPEYDDADLEAMADFLGDQ